MKRSKKQAESKKSKTVVKGRVRKPVEPVAPVPPSPAPLEVEQPVVPSPGTISV